MVVMGFSFGSNDPVRDARLATQISKPGEPGRELIWLKERILNFKCIQLAT
jgi:hypothetical protein